jgi:hypothetical protein
MLFIRLLSLRELLVPEIGSLIDLQYMPLPTARLAFPLVLYPFATNGRS